MQNLNPYNFKTYTSSFIGITVNREEVPFRPLQLSYTSATIRYIEVYLSMFFGTRKLFYCVGNGVSRDDFKDGCALYAAHLKPDMCGSSDHFNVVQRGNLALNLKFTTAPTAAVSLMCYPEFENMIHIDSERLSMNTVQIAYALEQDPKTSKMFCDNTKTSPDNQ